MQSPCIRHLDLWQEHSIAQCAQLQPQEDLPFFLSLMTIIAAVATMATRITAAAMVPMLFVIQEIIENSFPPYETFTFLVSLVASL